MDQSKWTITDFSLYKLYRVDTELIQRHIFDFWSEVQTGRGPSPYDIGIFRHEVLPYNGEAME